MNLQPRLTFLEYGSILAVAASSRSTCPRARVGCVLFDKNKRVVATGYNGVASGKPHCDDVGCVMVNGHCSNSRHAEKSANESCGGRKIPDGYAFITLFPCKNCCDLLIKMGIKQIFWHKEYPHNKDRKYVRKICRRKGIKLQQWPLNPVKLLQKAMEFHQGTGGILVSRKKLIIKEVEG